MSCNSAQVYALRLILTRHFVALRGNCSELLFCSPPSLFHLRTLQLLDRVDRIAIWDTDSSAIAGLTEQQLEEVGGTYIDLHQMLGETAPFFSIACRPNDQNLEACLEMFAAAEFDYAS